MNIDGTWEILIKATSLPITLKGTLEFKTQGNVLSGSTTTNFGTSSFTDGKIDGNKIEFSVDSATPFGPATLEITGTVYEDKLTGEAIMQPSGMKANLKGERTN